MKKQNIKRFAFLILMGIFFIPIGQSFLSLFNEKPLTGWVQPSQDIDFSIPSWIEGNYQFDKEKYLGDHFGFRNTLTRFHNEWDY